jgi:hypothetical protein
MMAARQAGPLLQVSAASACSDAVRQGCKQIVFDPKPDMSYPYMSGTRVLRLIQDLRICQPADFSDP